MKKNTLLTIGIMLFVGCLFRILPHPPNMTPLIAISLLATASFKTRTLQFGIPLVIMFLTDIILGFHSLIPVVYASILIAGLAGNIVKKKASPLNYFGTSLLGSILFFIFSNAGVWAMATTYPKTIAGLLQCYALAIPFFHNTVISTVLFVVGITVLNKVITTEIEKRICVENKVI